MSLAVKLELDIQERQFRETHFQNAYYVVARDFLGHRDPLQLTNEALTANELADCIERFKTRLDDLVERAKKADALLGPGHGRG